MMESNKAVRPFHADGYINLMNKWGTSQDTSEAYSFHRESATPDIQLTNLYEGNGLFARIIDTPAEEALKHGFDLGLNSPDVESFVKKSLDMLDWEEKAATALKWARLYGGSLIVMLIDDGRGLEEPLNWKNIRSIDELCVFERPIVWPDYSSLYSADFGTGRGRRETRFMQPQYYDVSSIRGSFRVHESRCLVFKNGSLPEGVSNENYRYWGLPEYTRIRRALQDTIIAHSNGPKLLERSVQPIYKMKNLASLMASDFGEEQALKRLQLIDIARGMMNTVAIDAEGEEYDFKTFSFSGVVDIIDSTCNMLSALTNIPQTILFGRSPAGENSTGESDMENWYSFVERIQRLSVKPNLHSLLDVLFAAGIASGEVEEEPEYDLKFNPLWSLSDDEQSAAEKTKADTAYVKAQTAQMYVGMQALDPSEVRSALAKSEDFEVEEILDDIPEDELFSELTEADTEGFESEQQIPPDDEPKSSNAFLGANQDDALDKHKHRDGGPGSGNFGHEGRKGEIGGSSPGDVVSERCGKISARLKEINDAQAKFLADMMSGEKTMEEFIKQSQSLVTESVSLKAELEELDPNSRTNVSRRFSEEGHPTQDQIVESLPKEWRETYSTAEEQTFGEAFLAKVHAWSGEGYREMKDDPVLSKAIELSSAKWDKGDLYRGLSMSDAQLTSLVPGASLQMYGLSSWSSDVSPAMSFATTEKRPVLIVDKTRGTRNALPIAQLSVRCWEKEVVYGKDQKFRVKSVSMQDVKHGTSANGSSDNFSKETVRKVTVIEVEAE